MSANRNLRLQHSRPASAGRSEPLADPLDGEEWRGLLWVLPLFAWLSSGGGRAPRATARPDGALMAAYRRTPSLIR